MIYKAKVAVCAENRTKHSMQSEHHAELLNVKPGGKYIRKCELRINSEAFAHIFWIVSEITSLKQKCMGQQIVGFVSRSEKRRP